MKISTLVLAAMTVLVLAGPFALTASPPDEINYQGVLRDAAGNPENGTHDMIFRLFSASAGGSEIFVDSHTTGGSGPVTVTDALFNVGIGSGVTADGAGPGTYTQLWEVFGDHSDVWIQIEIDGEVLSPRVHVLATPYAHNAKEIDGLSSGQLLRSDVSGSIDGFLSVDSFLRSGSDLYVNFDGPDETTRLFFYEDGSQLGESIGWVDSTDRFYVSDDLAIAGDFELNRAMTGYTANSFSLVADYSTDAFFGTRFEAGSLSSYIRIDPFQEIELVTQEGVELFEDDVNGTFRLMADFEDEDITFFIEGSPAALISNAENFSVYGSNLLIGRNGPDRDQDLEFYEGGVIEGERLQWDDSEDRFEFSDELYVFGDLGASGVKNFIQNHPEDPTLEIVYTSLEGNEATTFTRGTARLESGVATVALEESFSMVTNPELGLSVHLTPRGQHANLYTASLSTSALEVRSDGGNDVVFDYIVYGLRIGFEDLPVFRKKMAEAPIPPAGYHDAHYAERPELRRHTALERYRAAEQAVNGRIVTDMPLARALRAEIGERVPGLDVGAGEQIARLHAPDEIGEDEPASVKAEVEAVVAAPQMAAAADAHSAERTTPSRNAPVASSAPGDVKARSFRPTASDLASMHASSQTLRPGDVVVLSSAGDGRVALSKFAAEKTVFGVVASDPGLVLGVEDEDDVAITTSGVVTCKVDASYGPIRPGDLLVSSPTPGHAMRADDASPGTVLGKAIGAHEQGTGTIQIIVTLR